jgi:hypothetical protein
VPLVDSESRESSVATRLAEKSFEAVAPAAKAPVDLEPVHKHGGGWRVGLPAAILLCRPPASSSRPRVGERAARDDVRAGDRESPKARMSVAARRDAVPPSAHAVGRDASVRGQGRRRQAQPWSCPARWCRPPRTDSVRTHPGMSRRAPAVRQGTHRTRPASRSSQHREQPAR